MSSLADKIRPICELGKDLEFVWSSSQKKKSQLLINESMELDENNVITADASVYGISAVLLAEVEVKCKPRRDAMPRPQKKPQS